MTQTAKPPTLYTHVRRDSDGKNWEWSVTRDPEPRWSYGYGLLQKGWADTETGAKRAARRSADAIASPLYSREEFVPVRKERLDQLEQEDHELVRAKIVVVAGVAAATAVAVAFLLWALLGWLL